MIAARAMEEKYAALWAHLRNPQEVASNQAERVLKDIGAKPGDLSNDSSFAQMAAVAPKWIDHLTKVHGGKFPTRSELTLADRTLSRLLVNPPPKAPTHLLSQARDLYTSLHDREDAAFISNAARCVAWVTDTVGDKPLEDYSREDARAVSEAISEGGKRKSMTVKVYLAHVVAILNRGIKEWDLTCPNPFAGLDIRNQGKDAKKIVPFTLDELETIRAACIERNDPLAWLTLMQLGTGARLGEIGFLRVDDLRLDDEIPHIVIQEHTELGRTLKNTPSARAIPMVGVALWACRQAAANPGPDGWLLKYGAKFKSRLGKDMERRLLQILPGTTKRSHSFRYAQETRLTLLGVQQGIIDRLAGHVDQSKTRIASGYFGGFPLGMLQDALQKIALPAPEQPTT